MNLSSLQNELGALQTIAFTATADAATRADILGRLFRQQPEVFVHGFDRPNLRLAMSARNHGRSQLAQLSPGIAATVASSIAPRAAGPKTSRVSASGGRQGTALSPGMDATDRSRNQDVFLQEDGVVMTATIAFGMASTSPTSASSATTICRTTSRATIRRSAVPVATGCRPIR